MPFPCRARDLWLQGIQNLRRNPNPYLYQSLAVLAAEMDCVEEARKWFREGTRTLTVSCGACFSSRSSFTQWRRRERGSGRAEDVVWTALEPASEGLQYAAVGHDKSMWHKAGRLPPRPA